MLRGIFQVTKNDVFLEFHAGGCLLTMKEVEEVIVSEESQSADNLAAAVLSEDPHTVLVEFSSVVADTQEYIIEVRRDSQPALGEFSTGCGQEKLCSCSCSCSRLLGEGTRSQWDLPCLDGKHLQLPHPPKGLCVPGKGQGDSSGSAGG